MSTSTITRLTTSPIPRDLNEPVPTHIRHATDAVVRRLNATQHPNVVKMHDALDHWIGEANTRGGAAGIDYLAACAAQVEASWTEFQAAALADRPYRITGLDGLTVEDFGAITARMDRAVMVLSGEAS